MDRYAEPHTDAALMLNWIRAAVLGANDGIVSVAAIVVGVAGAYAARGPILVAGIAGLSAGALSMAVGEFVSVSSQRDTERSLMQKERDELASDPEGELLELVHLYERKGLSKGTALTVARELSARDAFAAHVETELRLDPDDLTNPWHAASASALSFVAGGVVPLIVVLIPPESVRILSTFASVIAALVVTGVLSARASGASFLRPTLRNVIGGTLAMLVTYGIGRLVGTNVA